MAVEIDMLRRGWPEQLLTGRYSFATYRRGGVLQELIDWADLLTDGLIERHQKRELHLRADGRTVMIVLTGRYPHLPPGIKVCGGSPASPLLVLCQRREPRPRGLASFFAPAYYDIVDHRLGVAIGSLEATGGFVRPARTVIRDSSQRVTGRLVQPLGALLSCWLAPGWNTYRIVVGNVRVAQIGWTRRRRKGDYQVDVTGAAGLLDPRLILACVAQKVAGDSDY